MTDLEKDIAEIFRIDRYYGVQASACEDSNAIGASRTTWINLRREITLALARNNPSFDRKEFLEATEEFPNERS